MIPVPVSMNLRIGDPKELPEELGTIFQFETVRGVKPIKRRLMEIAAVEDVMKARSSEGPEPFLLVTVACDGAGWPTGLREVEDALSRMYDEADAFRIYVSGADFRSVGAEQSFLYAGDGFVLCEWRHEISDGVEGDVGVTVHFLSDGERQRKWFIDGLANQVRELVHSGDTDTLRRLVSKHVDLDPPAAPRP